MYLTLSKRFEFSASYQLSGNNKDVSTRGSNFTAYFIFHGPVDSVTGMMINISEIKKKIWQLLESRYDHKNLNQDTKPFDTLTPSVENIARQLLLDAEPLFIDSSAKLVACHLTESEANEATAYADDRVESHRWIDFSAARSTRSPHLSDTENYDLFGKASRPSGHGHHYRLRVTAANGVDTETPMLKLHDLLDHRNLSLDLPELKDMPMTTECLARWIFNRLSDPIEIKRVCLWENPKLYAEYDDKAQFQLGIKSAFQSAHRLHSQKLSTAENQKLYEKCNNPAGHGHRYLVEACLSGQLDEPSGTLCSLNQFNDSLATVLNHWDGKHLDRDSEDFLDRPSTSENIISILHPRLESELDRKISRLRLWETFNNRFTIRRNKNTI